MRYRIVAAAAAVALGVCAHDASATLTFSFSRGSTTTNVDYNAILPKFQEAASRWSSIFNDDITVNLSVGYVTLGPGVIGSTAVGATEADYSAIANALTLDAKSADDATAVAHLPSGPAFTVLTRNQPSTDFLLTPAAPQLRNTAMTLPTAAGKAMGLLAPNGSAIDGTITFSKAYTFDYDPSDGISPTFVDFVGVATHEIGHALGFQSGVDLIDRYTGNGPLADVSNNLRGMAAYTPLDLFRHSTAAGLGVISGTPGDDAYFSLDGGATAGAQFSRGLYNGNNAQASHWLDNLGLGVMDPTAQKGELLSIGSNDRVAFDVMGYDLVPEPTALALLVAPAAALLARRRRGCRASNV